MSGPLTRDVGRKRGNMKTLEKTLAVVCFAAIATTSSLTGQETPPIQDQPTLYSFNCRDAALEVLLDRLQELTGKDITVDFGVQARFTLATTEKVTAAEMIDLITQALNAQGIRLENLDEKTIRVRGTVKPRDMGYAARRENNAIHTQNNLGKILQDYQMQVLRQGLQPLDVQLTPENIAILKSEGVAVPASVGSDETPEQ